MNYIYTFWLITCHSLNNVSKSKHYEILFFHNYRGVGISFFLVKHEKFSLHIQDAKNFSVVKPLNSGEAVASPVPPPLIKPHQLKVHLEPSQALFKFKFRPFT